MCSDGVYHGSKVEGVQDHIVNNLQCLTQLRNRYSGMRHGESKANVENVIISCIDNDRRGDYGLTDLGCRQALTAATRSSLSGDTVICSSDFARAAQTAQIVAAALGAADVLVTEALRERCFGDWEGTACENYAAVWAADAVSPDHAADHVEPASAVLARAAAFIITLEQRYSGADVLLISHGDTLQILQTGLSRMNPGQHRTLPPFAQAEIRRFPGARGDDAILRCMPNLLPHGGPLLVRTDFADDDAWDRVCDEATREYGPDGFCANVGPFSDPGWAGAAWDAVKAAVPAGGAGSSVLFIADHITLGSPKHPILVVDLQDTYLSVAEFPEIEGRTPFRCVPAALWEVENNLNLANMDWEDFADATDDDGVYRGLRLAPLTPEEKAAAERQARLQEQSQQERMWLAEEVRSWGGRLPSDRIRATSGNSRAMAHLDVSLAEAIAAASPGTQRSIARWAARRAYEVAGFADLDWVAPALQALDDGRELPPPFDDQHRVFQMVYSDPHVPHTTVAPMDGRLPRFLQLAMAVPALFAATEPDPLDAALQALYDTAVTFGGDDYPNLFQEVRSTFGL
jgi:broad specificity phosphatase PhoE